MSATPRPSAVRRRSDTTGRALDPRPWGAALATVAALWAALIIVTPTWLDDGRLSARATVAALVHLAGSRVCHQRPERSLYRAGRPMPVCGRCTGLYVSGAAGLLAAVLVGRRRAPSAHVAAAPESHRVPRSAWLPVLDRRAAVLAVAAVPTAVTWMLEICGVWNPGTPVRALAALPLGVTAGWLIGRGFRNGGSRL